MSRATGRLHTPLGALRKEEVVVTFTIPLSAAMVETMIQAGFFALGFALGWWSQKYRLL